MPGATSNSGSIPERPWRPGGRSLRAALGDGRSLLATFLLLPRVEVVEMLAVSGFDAVIVDLEHGPTTRSELTTVVSAAQGAGLFAIARLGTRSDDEIGRALDSGVDGLLVPHVSSATEAETIVRAGRFPPTGDRSINPYTRGNAYGVDGSTGTSTSIPGSLSWRWSRAPARSPRSRRSAGRRGSTGSSSGRRPLVVARVPRAAGAPRGRRGGPAMCSPGSRLPGWRPASTRRRPRRRGAGWRPEPGSSPFRQTARCSCAR